MPKNILRLHNRLWYDRAIPRPLQHILGTRFRINLETSDIKEALGQKAKCDALFSLTISKHSLSPQARLPSQSISTIDRRLSALEKKAQALLSSSLSTFDPDTGTMVPDTEEAMDVLSTIEGDLREHFLDLTSSRKIVRLSDHLEQWLLTMQHIHPRTLLERRTVAQKLIDWSSKNGANDVLRFTRDHARSFVGSLSGEASTINKAIQSPVSMWRYLKGEGIGVDPDIWSGLGPKKSRADKNLSQDRPFTLMELQKLFDRDNISTLRPDLRDAMYLSLFTGMRLAEVGELRISDVDLIKDIITVRGTKTSSALRTIPLHLRLKDLLSIRSKGRGSKDLILHELDGDSLKHGRKRSAKLSQAFTRYRESIGVTDDVEGKRRSLVNLHSLRRSAATAMMEHSPSIQPHVIDQFFGWSAGGAMRSRYSVGADMMNAMREALKALEWDGV